MAKDKKAAAKPPAKKTASKKPVARPDKPAKPPVTSELGLDSIDPTPAESVRAGYSREFVDRYAEAIERGEEMPPVDVFAGGKKFFLGDGGHRKKGAEQVGRKKILALVRTYDSEEEAFAAALVHAAGSNESHGYNRTAEDKRAAVAAVITRKEYAQASDTLVAEMTRTSHNFVRLVRERLTHEGKLSGPAASTSRDYKADAKLRGNQVSDGKGNLIDPPDPKAAPAPAPDGKPTAATPPVASVPVARPEARAERAEPARPRSGAHDARGRLVPAPLKEVFENGRAFANDFRGVLNEAFDAIQAASGEPFGAALPAVSDQVETLFNEAKGHVSSSVPYVVCPHVDEAGEHRQPGECRVCRGRKWASRHVWHQFPRDVKALCDKHAAPGVQPEAE